MPRKRKPDFLKGYGTRRLPRDWGRNDLFMSLATFFRFCKENKLRPAYFIDKDKQKSASGSIVYFRIKNRRWTIRSQGKEDPNSQENNLIIEKLCSMGRECPNRCAMEFPCPK